MAKGPKPLDSSAKMAAELDVEGILLLLDLLAADSGAVLEPIEREVVLPQLRIDHGCRITIAQAVTIVVFEFLARWKGSIGLRMRRYHRAAELKHSRPVVCELVLLTNKGAPKRLLREGPLEGQHRFRGDLGEPFRYRIHKLWEIPAAKLLALGRKELYPFVPLSKHQPADIQEADRRLDPRRDTDIRLRLRTYCGVYYGQDAILKLLGDGGDMLMKEIARESSVVQAIARKAAEEAAEEAAKAAREQTLRETAVAWRATLRALLADRFPELASMREIDSLDATQLQGAIRELFAARDSKSARLAILNAARR